MSKPIERLRFFDGEYLRSSDFTDEQAYHIEMRRRLNLHLHLHGIVYGLKIVLDQDSVLNAKFYSIAPGMAIDRSGREIVVLAPYSLSSGEVLNQPGLHNGDWEVWLCYQEIEVGGLAAGDQDCRSADQNTRWRESFKVVLMPYQGKSVIPDCGGVRIGTIHLINNNGWQISSFENTYRTYVGIRAQRVVAADEEPDTFRMATQNVDPTNRVPLPGYVDFNPGLFARGNAIVEKNLIIGDDFSLDSGKNPPNAIPDTGNVKITNDLFLQGEFYGLLSGKWYKLKDYIQSMVPYIAVSGPILLKIDSNTGKATQSISELCPLPDHGEAKVLLSITDIQWETMANLQKVANSINNIGCDVSASSVKHIPNSISYSFDIACEVEKVIDGPNTIIPITKVTVHYILIIYPS